MFKTIKHNKGFLLLLSTASLLIWGVIVYQIVWGLKFEPDVQAADQAGSFHLPLAQIDTVAEASFIEAGNQIRNPFQPYYYRKPQKKPRPVTKEEKAVREEKPPPLRYIGYLTDQQGSLAILQFKNGSTRICSPGDTVQGYRLTRIEKKRILASYQGKEFPIQLQP